MMNPVLPGARSVRTIGALILLSAAVIVLPAAPAHAHERREVGPFEFVVGWWEEPAFANQPNGPEVTITRDGDPVVEDVQLEVEITFGDQSTTLEIEPAFVVDVFGEEGSYNADVFPTRPGTYEFHFTGTVEGEDIDEVFTSGPDTFNDIEDPASIAFPAADPSNADLAERLKRETVRLASDVEAADGGSDSTARTLAIIALIGAVAAVALAGVGVVRKR